MDQDPLLQRMMNVKKEEALHSSGYVRMSRGERIGSTSAESFAARQAMEANRQVVRGYGDSKVGNSRNMVKRVGGYDAGKEVEQRAAIRERLGGERDNDARQGAKGAVGGLGASQGGDRFAPSKPISSSSAPARRNPGISR